MGSGSFSTSAYRAYTTSTAGKSVDEVYSSRKIDPSLNPKGVKIRESRDSDEHPESTPLIVAIDVTGSMEMIADVLAREGVGTLFTEVLEHKPITDPQVMFMAVGDANCDQAPLQVSQFESDNRVVEQLAKIWLEKGGGGNCFESYNLPWYFAANHTEHDAFIKRGKRGYLFTVGDEEAPGHLTKEQIQQFIGDSPEGELSSEVLLSDAQRTYDVYHVIVKEGNHARRHFDRVVDSWKPLLGQRVIVLSDHRKLSETIISAIEVAEGADVREAGKRYGAAVHDAVKHLPASRVPRRRLI